MSDIWKQTDGPSERIDITRLMTVDPKTAPTKKKLAVEKPKPKTSPKLKLKAESPKPAKPKATLTTHQPRTRQNAAKVIHPRRRFTPFRWRVHARDVDGCE